MNVGDLKKVLENVDDETELIFSYDFRAATRLVTIVDLVENDKNGWKRIYFRNESKDTWDRRNKEDLEYQPSLKVTNLLNDEWPGTGY